MTSRMKSGGAKRLRLGSQRVFGFATRGSGIGPGILIFLGRSSRSISTRLNLSTICPTCSSLATTHMKAIRSERKQRANKARHPIATSHRIEPLADIPMAKGAATPTRSHDATALSDLCISNARSGRWQRFTGLTLGKIPFKTSGESPSRSVC